MLRCACFFGSVAFAYAIQACGEDADPSHSTPILEVNEATGDDEATGSYEAGGVDAGPVSPFASRPYDVTQPSSYDPSVPSPLVVLLHGYGATARIQDVYFRISALAEAKNFLVALPNGTKDPLGNPFWNATGACCDFSLRGVDDVGYLSAVIDDMKQRFNVDPKRIYLIGHSNGGFMAHRLACEIADQIAAIVSLAGAVDVASCAPSEPVAVLQVHGDDDKTISYDGGNVFPFAPEYPSAKTTIATWAEKNGCEEPLEADSEKLDLDGDLPGVDTIVARHECTAGAAELWTIEGGSHSPSLQPTWAELVYSFLEAHPKP